MGVNNHPGRKAILMLSKINTLLLGLIAQKPLNPYEIQHILNKSHIRSWFPIAESSVYAGIRVLHEKGYIQGEGRKENNMPEKTIYCLTEKGSEALKNAVEQYLSCRDLDPVAFHTGILFMHQLDRDLARAIFNQKLKSMDEETFLLKKQLDESPKSYIAETMLKHRIYLIFSEAKTIRELLEKVEKDLLWNAHPIMDAE